MPRQIRIFIVDDHQLFIDGLKSLFATEEQFVVAGCANNGKEALQFLETTPVDVVLVDIEMPLMNGFDTASFIIKKHPGIKIIALTTHDEKSIIRKMVEVGASGYLLKNIDKSTLLEAINTVLDGRLYFSSEITVSLNSMTDPVEKLTANRDSALDQLSAREVEILVQIANGKSNTKIAEELFLSPKTIDTHRTNIMQKLNINNVVGLVRFALKNGLVE